jgi:hypothetical protein
MIIQILWYMEYITLLQYVVIHKKILLSAGINDPIVSRTETENPL